MVVQNDAETVERSLASFYPFVERIVVSTDPKRGWSGVSITPDDTLDRIRALDVDRKIDIVEGDFYRSPEPMKNDTFQRQITADRLAEIASGLDWVAQIDADEVFLDFPDFAVTLGDLPPETLAVSWRWINLFNLLNDGRFLVIVDPDGRPILEQFAIAHRPGAHLQSCRTPDLPSANRKSLSSSQYILPPRVGYRRAVLHYTYAKSERRIREKLQTWSHAHDFDTDAFLALWQHTKTRWDDVHDFHPIYPIAWPALRAFTEADLRSLQNTRPAGRTLRSLARSLIRRMFGRAISAPR